MATQKEIREYFGHNGGSCRVKLRRGARSIYRYGNPDNEHDRTKDFWAYYGEVSDREAEVDYWLENQKAEG